jgi:hypothetical protein
MKLKEERYQTLSFEWDVIWSKNVLLQKISRKKTVLKSDFKIKTKPVKWS